MPDEGNALGPGFWVAYALTGGTVFEPTYSEHWYETGLTGPNVRVLDLRREEDFSNVWMPPDANRPEYPIFRIAREGNTTRLQWMPGYPGLTIGRN
jgi:hypothetical protein